MKGGTVDIHFYNTCLNLPLLLRLRARPRPRARGSGVEEVGKLAALGAGLAQLGCGSGGGVVDSSKVIQLPDAALEAALGKVCL